MRRDAPRGRRRPSREERARIGGGPRPRYPSWPGPVRLSGPAIRLIGGVGGLGLVIFILSQLLGGRGPTDPGLPAGTPSTPAAAAWKERVQNMVRRTAIEQGLRETWVIVYEPGHTLGDTILTVVEFKVPGDLHMEVLNLALTRAVQEAGGQVVQGVERHDARVELEAAFEGFRTHRLVLQRYSGYRRAQGSIALIIDDFGRTQRAVLDGLMDLPIEWTASIIPGEPRASEEARLLTTRGVPFMIHMPMEPEETEAWDLGAGAIYTDTPAQDVDRAVARALESLPGAVGMNNHMGSLATTRPAVMKALMEALRKRDLFFVDSVTTAASIAAREAEQGGVEWGRRDVFLDPEDDAAVIDAQMQLAIKRARTEGSALVIAHPRQRTLDALRRWIPRAEEQGIQFVRVDRLLIRSGRQP